MAFCILVANADRASGFTQRQPALEFEIPPARIPFKIKDTLVTIVASGPITRVSNGRQTDIFRLEVDADLTDLQQNMTALLSAQLDKDDSCSEQIEIQHATLTPMPPASLAVVQLHYARRACVNVLGRRKSKTLVNGNAAIQLKLTPAVEANNTELRLVPEVGPIQADGSLGELLRAGPVGDMLRDKIRSAILSAMAKGTGLQATIPPVAQNYATIRTAQCRDMGSGQLMVALVGEIRMPKEQVREFYNQLNERRHDLTRPAN